MDTIDRKSLNYNLSIMVRKESENMTVNKHMFDVEHPYNAKSISSEQMMQMARNKIMQELSAPTCRMDENE